MIKWTLKEQDMRIQKANGSGSVSKNNKMTCSNSHKRNHDCMWLQNMKYCHVVMMRKPQILYVRKFLLKLQSYWLLSKDLLYEAV